jgi:hypothetical protein
MSAPLTIRLHANDNVVVARMDILPNTKVEGDVSTLSRVPPGHKILTRAVKKGEPLRKYNQIIGFATDDLPPGTHIHTHNCVMGDFERDYAFCADAHPTPYITPPATFMGYRRADGRAATRNYIGIVTTVNCSAGHQPHDCPSHRAAAERIPQHRRRRAADAWRRLRHGGVGSRDGCAASHARGLHAPSQHGGGGRAGPRLRDQSDLRPDERRRPEGRPKADPDGDPGRGRRQQDGDACRRAS